jgi:hypothetical protein
MEASAPTTTPAESSLLDTGDSPTSTAPDTTSTPAEAPQASALTPTFFQPDGTLSDGWTDHLPDDAVPYKETLAKYKTVPDMAKALANANALIGKKLGVPNEKSTPDEVSAFRKALGVPENFEEYDFTPTEVPEGFVWDKEAMKPFAEVAHKHNIPPSALKELAGLFTQYESSKLDVVQGMFDKQREAAVATLQKEWNADFTKNISVAKQAARLAGVDSTSYGFADPEVVRGFVRLAQMMSEDKVGRNLATPDMMGGKARAMDVMRNPENPWHKRYSDGNPEAVALVTGLLKQA